MVLKVIFTLFLVFLNGFFVAAEFAIVKVRTSQLELKIRSGSKFASLAKNLAFHLDTSLSATQLGITLASLGLGWIGESVVSKLIIDLMSLLGIEMTTGVVHSIALPAAFVTITIFHIVFGELAPKSIAIQKPEKISLIIALPLKIFYLIFKPFIWFLNTFANLMIRLLGFHPQNVEGEVHSSDELLYLIEESAESGVQGIPDKKILENIFDFSDTPVKQIMVPRGKILAIEINTELDEIIDLIIDNGFSRIPVYEKTIDNIIGILFAKDLIALLNNKDVFVLRNSLREAYYVDENKMINNILRYMQLDKVHLAIVIDEFGGTAGLVTLEDIIEEIVGEIQDEYDEEQPLVTKLNDKQFKILAYASIDDCNDYLPIPLPEDEDYETVGGLVINEVDRIPNSGEEIELENYVCKIINSSERNIESLILTVKEIDEK